MSKIPELSEPKFRKVIVNGKRLVVVDFFTQGGVWDSRIGEMLEEIRTKYPRDVFITKVDVKKNPELADEFDISTVPTILMFADGGVRERIVGPLVKKDLLWRIDGILRYHNRE